MDQQRFLIALVLSFLLLLAYEQLVVRPYRKSPPVPQTRVRERPRSGGTPARAGRRTSRPYRPSRHARRRPGRLSAPTGDSPVVTVETDLVHASPPLWVHVSSRWN